MTARMRRSARYLVADILYRSGVLKMRESLRRTGSQRMPVCVFGLHRIMKDDNLHRSHSPKPIIMRESTFEQMLAHVSRRFRVLSVSDFLRQEGGDGGGGKPACLITFDDGWGDNFSNAYPWLRKFGIPALIFLVTRLIGSEDVFWGEKLASFWEDSAQTGKLQSEFIALTGERGHKITFPQAVEYLKHMPARKREEILASLLKNSDPPPLASDVDRMMDWDQVVEMSRAGTDFGAHTETHPLLVYESDETVQRELQGCKKTIEEKVGARATAFAYPNGSWDQRVRGLVERAGYSCAFSTRPGWHTPGEDLLTVRRVLLHEGNVTGRDGRFSPAIFEYTLMRGF